ncbi:MULTISPECIES: sugar ABC transporter ATP-binding protein [unclassified Bradyrhizobium]|uniref:sugar ABC transporter ATP-binding protein n=1 Tax=unclassified Bradyrhizobium TaxID=2631580 RepID=UPI002479E4C5|nr:MULTISPECIES: sugar ABC transporter ATP-binding protein [unclassified Bradyrhizobium]WGR68684.1 sugar ABC transporter ATP-binding protein [Bradyrhizobium sp. ISRA426]WGR80739.1 sugar ABC transporter ATP-binding protein [Bradyrhizobium sp. ISRA430]WGR83924.1 sugar ABC transporter ATP-binding protein [Bradyrhizobium sp. ISRA432]
METRFGAVKAREGRRASPPSPLVEIGKKSAAGAHSGEVVLLADRVSKSFAGVKALQDVDFDLRRGEVHALMGENGAGKSTLMKILAGVHTDYQGAILVEGCTASFTGVRDAENAGIAIIHQELNLVPELSVADNIFLGREPLIGGMLIDGRRMVRAAERLLQRLGVTIAAESRVAELRVGEQQLVEIAKALSLNARILIMDEPTSALSSSECGTLFKIVRQLASEGVAIIYTSHRIEEVLDLADRVTVLRDGRRVVTAPIGELSRGAIISAMVGRDMIASDRGTVAQNGAIVLSVSDLTLDTLGPHGWKRTLHGISFELRRGEVLGIGGLLGAGRTEILESIFGVARGWRGGEIAIDGVAVEIGSPADAYRLGVALVSEDRKERGLHLTASICDNIALPSISAMSRFGLRAFAAERALAAEMVRRLSVRCTGISQQAAALSGGNQQKVVIGKWLATEPRILLLDEPTRGIDIGAKQEIYRLIFDLAAQGLGIVVVTSELPELLLLSDRILVMCEGRQTGILSRESATQEAVMRLAAPGMAAWAQETAS